MPTDPRLVDERARVSEAATAAWRAWRYPVDNRTARARDLAPTADLAIVPADERARRAEFAWDEALRRP